MVEAQWVEEAVLSMTFAEAKLKHTRRGEESPMLTKRSTNEKPSHLITWVQPILDVQK